MPPVKTLDKIILTLFKKYMNYCMDMRTSKTDQGT